MARVPYVFPYQGSKRRLATKILDYFPASISRVVEPFAGSAAVSIAALHHKKADEILISDINTPLMKLWEKIIQEPHALADTYETLWQRQLGQERTYYDDIRERFNTTHEPELLLFLMMRCVKAAIRYNADGDFNQSPDNRRKGTRPQTMRKRILKTARLLHNQVTILHGDYREILARVTPTDLIYLDPPYQGVTEARDPRYYEGVARDEFIASLVDLRNRCIPFIVSYDGRTGDKTYGDDLPSSLDLAHMEIAAGRSSQATLLGRKSQTYESLYVSPDVLEKV